MTGTIALGREAVRIETRLTESASVCEADSQRLLSLFTAYRRALNEMGLTAAKPALVPSAGLEPARPFQNNGF